MGTKKQHKDRFDDDDEFDDNDDASSSRGFYPPLWKPIDSGKEKDDETD